MVDSISKKFFSSLQQDQESSDNQMQELRRGLLDFNKQFVKSIKVTKELVKTLNNKRTVRELQKILEQSRKFTELEKKLKQEGSTISSKEAKGFLEVAKSLNTMLMTNKEIIKSLKQQKIELQELDLKEALEKATEKLVQESITFAESTNFNFQTSLESSLIPEEEIPDDQQLSNEATIEAIKEVSQTIKDEFKKIREENQSNNEIFVEADEVTADHQIAVEENLDDIKDNTEESSSRGFLSRLFGASSPLGKLFGGISGLFGKFSGRGGLLRGGAIGLGGLLGFDALGDIREEGLTTGNFLQSTGSGALIGAAFGPIGALIGGGIGALAAVITDSLNDEQIATIKRGFDNIKTFFNETISQGIQAIGPLIASTVDLLGTFFKDPLGEIDEAFDSIGNFINDMGTSTLKFVTSSIDEFVNEFEAIEPSKIITNIQEALSNLFSPLIQIEETVNSFIDNPLESIKSFLFSGDEEETVSMGPQAATVPVPSSLESSQELESSISQASLARTIVQSNNENLKSFENQQKETRTVILNQEKEKQKNTFRGRISKDNSPTVTSDIGLFMILGGGV